jgi:hypothetical protein
MSDPGQTPVPEPPAEPEADSTLVLWAFWCGALAASMVLAAWVAPEANEGFADGAAALAFIATVAVGIERAVEIFWTIVARSNLGGWWPLNQVRSSILAFEANTDALLAGPLAEAKAALVQAKGVAAQAGTSAAEVDKMIATFGAEVDRLEKKVTNAKKLAPGSPRFELLSEAASDAVGQVQVAALFVEQYVPKALETAGNRAEQLADACDRATDIVSSFSDNPARKLLSLMLGAIIGVIIAGFMGLNLFLAALGEGEDFAADLGGTVGIILTGVIIGFGANPTHEVIKALQRRKADNTVTTTPLGATAGGAVIPLPGGPGGPGTAFLVQPPAPSGSPAEQPSASYRRARTIRGSD